MADQRIEPMLAENASPAAPAGAVPVAGPIREVSRPTRLGLLLEREHVLAGVLLTPTLVILALFIAYPFLLGIWLAVSDKVVGRPGNFVGLENFRVNLADTIFLRAFQNTFVYTFIATAFKLALGMLAALLLNHHFRFKRIVRASMLRNEIYAKHNLIALDCFAIGPETSGWFRKEVKNVAEMKGIKMRFFGLGAQVMQKLGVNTQLMAAADIYPALERGVIDATEFSMPTMDLALGFHQIAKNNYYPGWHQQVSVSELLMNKTEWDKLSEQHKRIIQVALNDAVIHTYVETEAKNPPVMQEMKDKHKVTNRRWSDDDLRIFEKAWLEVLAEESAKDPLFKKVADHFLNWRKTYKIWGDAQELKSSYQKQ